MGLARDRAVLLSTALSFCNLLVFWIEKVAGNKELERRGAGSLWLEGNVKGLCLAVQQQRFAQSTAMLIRQITKRRFGAGAYFCSHFELRHALRVRTER